jgi:stage II sporulation protein R
LVLTVLFCILPNKGDAELYDEFIRLHIIANSDSEDDQALKLKVRDAVLTVMADLTRDCATVAEAETVFVNNKVRIAETALDVINENGADYKVSVTLSDEYYPTREYAGVTLPAGVYRSARILIGQAQGHNWWCILFPPLCTDMSKAKDKLTAAGFTQNQIRILTDGDNVKYKLKFKTLEIIQEIIESIKQSAQK